MAFFLAKGAYLDARDNNGFPSWLKVLTLMLVEIIMASLLATRQQQLPSWLKVLTLMLAVAKGLRTIGVLRK